jgi:3-phosphoshikimate 1-carboxyvinyltransferase
MTQGAVRIRGGLPLRGDIRLGPDRAVLETTLAVAALANGHSELSGVAASSQLEAALAAWAQLGVSCSLAGDRLSVRSPGLDAFHAPTGAIECGRSARLLAQLTGVLCGQRFGTQLRAAGCPDLPVEHWVLVLRARGAHIAARGGQDERLFPPINVAPLLASEPLLALDASLPFSDAVGKDAILLNALFAAGPTVLSEPQISSDHLERALVEVGLPLRRIGSVVSLDAPAWSRALAGLGSLHMPGSAAHAALFAALVQALPGSDVTLRGVSINPSQSGVLDVLRSWGAAITFMPTGDAALREPQADLRIRPAAVRGGVVDADLLLRAGEAVPALWLIGALSRRGVRLCELQALEPQQRDPGWSKLDALFARFGVTVDRSSHELFVPQSTLQRAPAQREWDAGDDPDSALAACTLALATPGETVVQHGLGALSAMHPGFLRAAQELGASIEYV